MQDLAIDLVEPHEVHTVPPLKPVQVLLDEIPSLQRVYNIAQLGIVGKTAEGELTKRLLDSS